MNVKCFELYLNRLFVVICFCFRCPRIACQTAVHKKCHEKLLGTCSESGFNSESTIVSDSIRKLIQFQ